MKNMYKLNDFEELGVKITVKELKSYLSLQGINWTGECTYVGSYDEYDGPIWVTSTMKDTDILEASYGVNEIELVLTVKEDSYNRGLVKVIMTPLKLTISKALHTHNLTSRVFMLPQDVSESWMIYLSKHKRGYTKKLAAYYDRKIKEIKEEAQKRIDSYIELIEKETAKKIEDQQTIKNIIDKKRR